MRNNPVHLASMQEGHITIEHRVVEDFRVICNHPECNMILGDWNDWTTAQVTIRVHNSKVHPDATGN